MVKLNKNQQKFFKEAIDFYGENARDVRFKALKEFAELHDLIVPTSALKKYCQEDGQTRGHYNLTLVGIEPTKQEVESLDFPDKNEVMIKEKSVYADPVKKRSKRIIDVTGMDQIRWKNPVYLLIDSGHSTVSVHYTPEGAYKNKWIVLHSDCDIDWKEAKKEILYTGKCIINSTNSGLWCAITVMEMEP